MARRLPAPRVYCTRLLTDDFDRLWRFYRDVIGLRPVKGHGTPPYGEFVERGRVALAIFDRKLMAPALGIGPEPYSGSELGRFILGFSVPDVDRVGERLVKESVVVLRSPTDRPEWGLRTLHLRDPEGNVVELFTRIPPNEGSTAATV